MIYEIIARSGRREFTLDENNEFVENGSPFIFKNMHDAMTSFDREVKQATELYLETENMMPQQIISFQLVKYGSASATVIMQRDYRV